MKYVLDIAEMIAALVCFSMGCVFFLIALLGLSSPRPQLSDGFFWYLAFLLVCGGAYWLSNKSEQMRGVSELTEEDYTPILPSHEDYMPDVRTPVEFYEKYKTVVSAL